MKNKIIIIANGPIKNKDLQKYLLKDSNILICADGGANFAKELGLIPHYIIGDLDSIKDFVYKHFKNIDKTKIIKDKNQDKTDLELAIELAVTMNPSEIFIFGAIGNRIDHTLANIYCLNKIKPKIKSIIVNGRNTIQLVKENTEISGKKNDIVSIIPLSDISNLNYSGFKWNVNNLDTNIGWFGLSNKLEKNKGSISFSEGKILVIRVGDNND